MPADAPKVDDSPGLVWRLRKRQQVWVATWQCRTDLAALGYMPSRVPLWAGKADELGELEHTYISSQCRDLQDDMLLFARGGVPEILAYDGTFRGLALAYLNDPDSRFHKLRYATRVYYNSLIKRVIEDKGAMEVADMKARDAIHWHEQVKAKSGTSMAHAVMTMARTIVRFGATFLECGECQRLSGALHSLKFQMGEKRYEHLRAEQATAIRAEAHRRGLHSMALAQAIQFECTFRQKDCIGEWVPQSEPGVSDVVDARGHKWLRGIRWEEINAGLILRHTTSKRQKVIEINLNLAPMVLEEFARLERPSSGPVIVAERSGLPWRASEFRRLWREVATAVGVPKAVRNMDSRAGAITEATDAGADLESVRHAATHSNITTTQGYSRGSRGKIDNVMQLRVASRNKK